MQGWGGEDWDWEEVVRRSYHHAVMPMLYRVLKDYWIDQIPIPPDVLEELKNTLLTNTAVGMRRYYELANVLKILNENNIPVIVLKGACLASIIYKEMGLRTMSDVDLLFKAEQLAAAQALLAEKGYPAHSEKLNIDYHWTLDIPVHSVDIPMESVWERALPVEIEGVPARILAPEDLVLHLIMHVAYQHLFRHRGLRELYDIREVIAYYDEQIDWREMEARASEWKMTNSALLTLYLVRKLLGAKIPEDYIKHFGTDEKDAETIDWATQAIFDKLEPAQTRISPQFSILWSQEPFKIKAKYFFRLLFPSSKEMSTNYPVVHRSLRNYLYYFTRFKEHVSNYCALGWRMIKGDKEIRHLVESKNRDIAMRKWLKG